jgi:hypothetical protein
LRQHPPGIEMELDFEWNQQRNFTFANGF